jgi:methylphosphotriester-DNA--protein-cysteine methyltransferase
MCKPPCRMRRPIQGPPICEIFSAHGACQATWGPRLGGFRAAFRCVSRQAVCASDGLWMACHLRLPLISSNDRDKT